MIAVCPLTTAGAPSDEAKESAIVHAPRPTTPTPANNFNPRLIMICTPQCRLPNLHRRQPRNRRARIRVRHAHAPANPDQTTLGFVVVAERDFKIPFTINCCNALWVLRPGWPAPRSHLLIPKRRRNKPPDRKMLLNASEEFFPLLPGTCATSVRTLAARTAASHRFLNFNLMVAAGGEPTSASRIRRSSESWSFPCRTPR